MSGLDPNMSAVERPKETPEEKKIRKEAEKKAKAEEKARKEAEKAARAAQRGQKAAILTAPDPSDPHGSHYGDAEVVQSKNRTDSVWTKVADLGNAAAGQEVRSVASNVCWRCSGRNTFGIKIAWICRKFRVFICGA